MANRVLIGKRGSDYGLFISQKGVDVTDTSSTVPLAFDSRTHAGLVVSAKGENSLAPAASAQAGIASPTSVTISHGLGYTPLVAVRWCIASDLSSGVATKMYSPYRYFKTETTSEEEEGETEEYEDTTEIGCTIAVNTSNLVIYNHFFGESRVVNEGNETEYFGSGKQTIYYTYVIFKAKDTTGGNGL